MPAETTAAQPEDSRDFPAWAEAEASPDSGATTPVAAAALAAKLGGRAEVARELAYRLYTLCERKKRATEALSYNALVQSWPEITRLAREGAPAVPLATREQDELFGDEE